MTLQSSRKVAVQFASDLHLEFCSRSPPLLKVAAPYLVLAGDIGNPFHYHYGLYLQSLSAKYNHVYLVAGNHEYYNTNHMSINDVNNQIHRVVSNFKNVTFLNNTAVDIDDDVRILGTTLWTHIPQESTDLISERMNDYRMIYQHSDMDGVSSSNKLITPLDTTILHQHQSQWLQSQIEHNIQKRLLVVTHHLPSTKFICAKYRGNPINCAFATNLDHLLKSPVTAWICGHTHSCTSFSYQGVQCEVNSRGYPKEDHSKFRDDAVIYI
jgi:predicted phosphohydrolase